MPYLASALFACAIRVEPGSGTIAIDPSWQLHADPALVDGLDVGQLGRLLVHLTAHLIRDYAGRAQRLGVAEDNARARWNRCTDAEINDGLFNDDWSWPWRPTCRRTSGVNPAAAESYYEKARDGQRRWDCGSGADGCEHPGDGHGGIDPQQAELLRLGVAAESSAATPASPAASPAAGCAGPSPSCPRGSTGGECSPQKCAAPSPPWLEKWTTATTGRLAARTSTARSRC